MRAAFMSQAVVHRFFFALKPDDVTARRTHVFAEEMLGPKGLLGPERHHVTLALTDDMPAIPSALVDRLLQAGEVVRSAPFELTLNQLSVGYGTVSLRPSHVVPPLRDLQGRIAQAMAGRSLAMRKDWKFSPHETLCYRKAEQATQRPVEGFRWAVSEFVLVHSYVGLHRHETIGRWPLQAAEDPQGSLL